MWGTNDGDNIVWGTALDGDNIVWGTDDGDNIVWGTAADGDNIVWGTDGGDNIVWGTADDGDNIVWGTSDGDNIVWGTADGDNIVWGTAGSLDTVWVTTPDGSRSQLSGSAVFDRLSDRQLLTLLEYSPPVIAPESAPGDPPASGTPNTDVVTDVPAPTAPATTPIADQTTLGGTTNNEIAPSTDAVSDPMATRTPETTTPIVPGGGF